MRYCGLFFLLVLSAFGGAATAQVPPQATPTAVLVFDSIVSLRIPAGFKVASEIKEADYYALSLIPQAESAETWTEMVSVTGNKGLGKTLAPSAFTSVTQTTFKTRCPASYAFLSLGELSVDGRPTSASVHGCGSAKADKGDQKDISLNIVFRDKDNMLSVQWSVRGAAENAPPQLDRNVWASRIKALEPIKVCPRVPGEKAPFPSCLSAAR